MQVRGRREGRRPEGPGKGSSPRSWLIDNPTKEHTMHSHLSLDAARAFESEIRRRGSRPESLFALELKRERRSRRSRRSR
jgi:hypothetical protein